MNIQYTINNKTRDHILSVPGPSGFSSTAQRALFMNGYWHRAGFNFKVFADNLCSV